MTLLQILSTDTIFSTDFLFSLEIILIVVVIILQLALSLKVYRSIRNLQSIFKKRLFLEYGFIEKSEIRNSEDIESKIRYEDSDYTSEDEEVKLSLVKSSSSNEVMKRMRDALRSYLIKNYGAVVNFSIIKDIIDREVDVEDEGISQSISTPLYLGLAATMIGIIFGLWAMPELKGESFLNGIDVLINGVKYAMIASFFGLLCTTILSSFFYKKAKNRVLKDKNEQLSYLQAKLLPELLRAEDTGVSGLKASLDRFAREASKTTDNLKDAAKDTSNTVQNQLEIINKVETLNMTKVSKTNLELFNRLDANMQAFDKFSNYLNLINNISENLVQFSKKTENIETLTEEIKSTLQDSKELSKFLTMHFQQIQNAGGAALNAVDLSDAHFREAIEKLTVEIDNRIKTLNSKADNADSSIKETFDNIGTKLNNITAAHLDKLTVAYNDSVPHFEQLDNLNLLPELGDKSATQSKELVNAVNLLNTSLINLSERITNQSVLAKLDEIEKNLKRRTTTGKQSEEPKPKIGFFKRIRNNFRHKDVVSDEEE